MEIMCFLTIPGTTTLNPSFLISSIALLLLCSHANQRVNAGMLIPKLNNNNNATDRSSLLIFKSGVSLDPRGSLIQWNDSVHFCRWNGVTCGHRHPERVVALQLPSLDLVGMISPALANLTFLAVLNLVSNHFHGQIPQELGSLSRLENLHLGNNSLGGIIPRELGHCKRLRVIKLQYNMLVGHIPSEFGSLRSLINLTLSNNSITGQIPTSLANISSLSGLKLTDNQLSGGIPPSLGQLSKLTDFQLAFNNLDGEIPTSLWNISSLEVLYLDNNQLHGSLPPDLGRALPNSEFLSLSNNKLHGEIPMSLPNASRLALIQLQGNNFSGTIPPNLGSLTRLLTFDVYKNQLQAKKREDWDFLTSLTNCTMLEELQLAYNNLGGVLPRTVANLSTHLWFLYIGGNYIQGSLPPDIGNLVGLEWFDAGPNQLTGPIPGSIGLLQYLYALDLSLNYFSGEIPSTIGNLSQLNGLYLSGDSLSGSIPASLANCKSLAFLDLGYNKLTGTIPKQVLNISSLSIYLSFEENLLAGSIPSEVGSLVNLGKLYLSGNNFSGEIPESLGKCQVLQVLSLGRNFFRGSIPASLSTLRGLEVLDLSGNNLSGRIPAFLEEFRQLHHLNLSFNNLEGEVPTKGVFANASAVSVLGNDKLCGGNPMLHLPTCTFPTIPKKKKNLSHSLEEVVIILTVSLFLVFFIAASCYWMKRKSRRKPRVTDEITEQHINISYAKLIEATDGFSDANLIGSGNFGDVYKGELDDDQEHGAKLIAVKVFNLQKLGALKSFIAECDAIRNIRHRNIMRTLTVCSGIDFNGNDFKAMVFKFMANGSLESWLHPEANDPSRPQKYLNLTQRINIAIDVASALEYLHHHGQTCLVHSDIKPSNILLDHDMTALLCDFGLARFLKNSSRGSTSSLGMRGTIGYIAPEYGVGNKVSTHGDVYSYGVLLLELFTGKRPTDDTFKEGLTLPMFVECAFPERVIEIVDERLLAQPQPQPQPQSQSIEERGDDTQNIDDARAVDCASSLLRIGLLCTKDLSTERMQMEMVTNELKAIRNIFLQN